MVGVINAESDRVLLAVVQQADERRQVDTIRFKVKGVNAGNRPPQERVDSAGEDPGINRRYAGRLTIDADLALAERSRTAVEQLTGNIVGSAGVPEFVVLLALRENVQIGAFGVGGSVKVPAS